MALSKISGTTGIADATITSVKLADFAQAVDLNGVELLLDADQDTSITADTDDRIDFKIANVEHFSFSNSSGDTVIKPMVDGKDIIFQQYDGNKVFEINDGNFVSIGGNASAPGEIRIYEDTDLGSHYSGFKVGNLTSSVAYQLPLTDATASGQALTSNSSGVLSWSTVSANVPTSADGQALGSEALEWSDLFLADASTIKFGADQDVVLTHVHNTGLLLNTASVVQFRDAAINIGSPADGDLDINADDEIELNSTLIDINGNVEISGTLTQTGIATFPAIPVFSAGINVSGGTIAGTLATAAQANVTSLGTLTALTVDDVAVDGKVITMTGSSGDTFVTTVAANGATSLVTTDASSAAAHLQITADGTVDIDSAGVLTLDSGAAINIEPASGSAILLDGTISVDAGVVTGATSITSTAFVGDITGDVTGTADVASVATTVTITDNESTNESNALIFTAGGDVDGGNLGLESDGTLTYNPSTGKVTATGFVGTLTGNVTGNASGTALTVTQAAQSAITSVGTLTALTVDDVAIDGKVMTMTGSSGDTFVTTVAANGATSLVTTDAGGAAAHLQITADGTVDIDGTVITLDSAGDIVLDGNGAVIVKEAGTELVRLSNSGSDVILKTAVSDKDFMIKGNDGGATITPFKLDMSAGGDLFLTGGLIDLKNDGSAISQIKFYCEASNAHAQTLIGAPHSETATNTLTLPSTGGNVNLLSTASTAVVTNKTFGSDILFNNTALGIVLGNTSNADANTLDDYEEGTWTPALDFGGGTTGIAYATNYQYGSYTKIGNVVHCHGMIILSNKGSSTGAAYIGGIPFSTPDALARNRTGSMLIRNVSFANQYDFNIARNSASATLTEVTEGGTSSNLTNANFANNSQVILDFTIIIA